MPVCGWVHGGRWGGSQGLAQRGPLSLVGAPVVPLVVRACSRLCACAAAWWGVVGPREGPAAPPKGHGLASKKGKLAKGPRGGGGPPQVWTPTPPPLTFGHRPPRGGGGVWEARWGGGGVWEWLLPAWGGGVRHL